MAAPSPRRPRRINQIVGQLLGRWQGEAKKTELILTSLWKQSVGEKIAEHTKPLRLAGKKLLVQVENSTWMYELTFMKEEITMKAARNFAAQGITIEEIAFKTGLAEKKTEKRTNVPLSGE